MTEGHPVVKNVAVDLGALAQPLTKLIEVVAQGTGNLYKPVGTVLQAYADKKANIILAEGEEKISEMRQRAAIRLAYIEVERQKNLEAIVEKAQAALPVSVADTPLSNDWITHFFDAAQDVSDEDMQKIWARILAGEVAEPGNTSRRTLEFLKTMGQKEAELFAILLSVCCRDQNSWHFYIEDGETSKILSEQEPDTNIERHMQDIGLVTTNPIMIDVTTLPKETFSYGNEKYKIIGLDRTKLGGQFRFPGPFLTLRHFTAIGQELSDVATFKLQPDAMQRISGSLERKNCARIEKDEV